MGKDLGKTFRIVRFDGWKCMSEVVGCHWNFRANFTWLFSTFFFFSCSFGVDWKLSSPCTSSMPELFIILKTDNASWKSLVPKTSSFNNLNILVSSSCGIKISQCNQHDQDIIWSQEGGNWDFHSRCKVLLLLLLLFVCLFSFISINVKALQF